MNGCCGFVAPGHTRGEWPSKCSRPSSWEGFQHVLLSALTAAYPKVLPGLPTPLAAAPSAEEMYPQLLPRETTLRFRSQSLHPPPDLLLLSEHLCQASVSCPRAAPWWMSSRWLGGTLPSTGGAISRAGDGCRLPAGKYVEICWLLTLGP